MSRADVQAECRETLGLVPQFLADVPDFLIESEWESFKNLELSDQTAIPNKYKELIGLAVSGARCRYYAYFHTEAAKLFGATEEEIRETALMAKHTMGWSSTSPRSNTTARASRPSSTRSPTTSGRMSPRRSRRRRRQSPGDCGGRDERPSAFERRMSAAS